MDYRQGDNPAAWKGALEPILGKVKQEIQRQPSLPYLYSEIQGFMAALLQREGMALTTLITRLPAAELEAGRKGFLDPKQDRVVTTHGFRDWAANQTSYPREVCEHALAHKLLDSVEAAYLRSDFLEKRSRLMSK